MQHDAASHSSLPQANRLVFLFSFSFSIAYSPPLGVPAPRLKLFFFHNLLMGFCLAFLFATLILGANAVIAVPASPQPSFSTLAPADISKFRPFTFYASSAYCSSVKTKTWSCGGKE